MTKVEVRTLHAICRFGLDPIKYFSNRVRIQELSRADLLRVEAITCRSPGRDDVAWLQRDGLRDGVNKLPDVEDHLRGSRVLQGR